MVLNYTVQTISAKTSCEKLTRRKSDERKNIFKYNLALSTSFHLLSKYSVNMAYGSGN